MAGRCLHCRLLLRRHNTCLSAATGGCDTDEPSGATARQSLTTSRRRMRATTSGPEALSQGWQISRVSASCLTRRPPCPRKVILQLDLRLLQLTLAATSSFARQESTAIRQVRIDTAAFHSPGLFSVFWRPLLIGAKPCLCQCTLARATANPAEKTSGMHSASSLI